LIALQAETGLVHPFICREGTEIHIPTGYFAAPAVSRPAARTWEVIELGPWESYVRAMRLLRSVYRSWNHNVPLIGLGDDWSDRFLLLEVDFPIIVRNDAVDQTRLIDAVPGAYLTRETGPAGWAEAILGSVPAPCP
jgi:predicted mannosyl-3-phosphoglycerate phosphatase (HAD superfamily)